MRIAKAIQERRDKAALLIKEVARRASVPVSTVQRLEDADPRWVSLAQFFNLTVSAAHSVSRQDLFARVRVIVSFELKIPHIIP